jgi:hypothetical protein
MQLRYAAHGAVWLILYLVFILAPLLALLAGSLPPTRDFWTEFSVAIGYAGLAMMGLQFGLTVTRRLDGREGLHHRRDVQAPPAAAVCRPRVLHLRAGRDDGCDRKGARPVERTAVEIPFRAL